MSSHATDLGVYAKSSSSFKYLLSRDWYKRPLFSDIVSVAVCVRLLSVCPPLASDVVYRLYSYYSLTIIWVCRLCHLSSKHVYLQL